MSSKKPKVEKIVINVFYICCNRFLFQTDETQDTRYGVAENVRIGVPLETVSGFIFKQVGPTVYIFERVATERFKSTKEANDAIQYYIETGELPHEAEEEVIDLEQEKE